MAAPAAIRRSSLRTACQHQSLHAELNPGCDRWGSGESSSTETTPTNLVLLLRWPHAQNPGLGGWFPSFCLFFVLVLYLFYGVLFVCVCGGGGIFVCLFVVVGCFFFSSFFFFFLLFFLGGGGGGCCFISLFYASFACVVFFVVVVKLLFWGAVCVCKRVCVVVVVAAAAAAAICLFVVLYSF